MVAIAIVVAPQLAIPSAHRIGPPALVPIVEGAVFVVMLGITALPGPVPRGARPLVLALFTVLVIDNIGAAIHLVEIVLRDSKVDGSTLGPGRLLTAGLLVLVANVVTFALLYWELDGGGPQGRYDDPPPLPDFQFPQTRSPELADPAWRPRFADHLYLSYTNLVTFGPADAVPLTIRVKALMAAQSLIAVSVAAVVLARVINLLPQ